MSPVPGQELLRHRTGLGYLSGETNPNVLKEGAVTNAPIIISTYQLLNALGVKALLALSHGPGLSGKKLRR